MAIVGGLRARLIRESLFQHIETALGDLGWTTIEFLASPKPNDEAIELNTLVLSDEDLIEDQAEMGSLLAEHRWTFYVDFYAADEAIGLHVIRDVKDIVGGRIPSIGVQRPNFPVYDFTQATPPVEFYCDIEDVVVDRAHDFPKPWQKYWYACRFTVVDHYADEDYS